MVLYAQFILGHFSKCFYLSGESNSLGLTFGYSYADVLHFFQLRSTEQLQCYSHFIAIWDGIFPLVYTAMYLAWMRYLLPNWRLWSILPLLHMLMDWAENYFEIQMVNEYLTNQTISDVLVAAGSTLTMLKWILSFLTYGILLYGILHRLIAYIKHRKN